jgi:hypothetical protein
MSRRSISIGVSRLAICAGLLIAVTTTGADAQSARKPTGTLILGEVNSLAVDNMSDPASGGRLVVDGKTIIVPQKLAIGLKSGPTSLQALMVSASDTCKTQQPPQSGLATTDTCRGEKSPALARVVASANSEGDLVASVVMVMQNSANTLARMKPATDADGSYGRPNNGSYANRQRRQAQKQPK